MLALQGGKKSVKEFVNEAALNLKLKELQAGAHPDPDTAWLETLAVTAEEPLALEDTEDDLKRELAFYNQALAAVQVAQSRFVDLGVPHVRPDDYFAEMVKSYHHMNKVRARLRDRARSLAPRRHSCVRLLGARTRSQVKRRMVNQQHEIIEQEERRKQKANKKFGKQVQRETLTARAQQKKRDIAEVTKLRKSKKGQVRLERRCTAGRPWRAGAAGSAWCVQTRRLRTSFPGTTPHAA